MLGIQVYGVLIGLFSYEHWKISLKREESRKKWKSPFFFSWGPWKRVLHRGTNLDSAGSGERMTALKWGVRDGERTLDGSSGLGAEFGPHSLQGLLNPLGEISAGNNCWLKTCLGVRSMTYLRKQKQLLEKKRNRAMWCFWRRKVGKGQAPKRGA